MLEPGVAGGASPLEQISLIFQGVILKFPPVSLSPAAADMFFSLAVKCVRERTYKIEGPIVKLAKEFKISSVTAKKGIDELTDLGIIKKQQAAAVNMPTQYFWVSPYPAVKLKPIPYKKGPLSLGDIIEAVIFQSGDPISIEKLAAITDSSPRKISKMIKMLGKKYEQGPIQLAETAQGFMLYIMPEFAKYIEKNTQPKKRRLTHAELEALSVVFYKTPVTAQEISRIRGANSFQTLQALVKLGFIMEVKKEDSPALYSPTEAALSHFGFRDLSDLPPLPDIPQR